MKKLGYLVFLAALVLIIIPLINGSNERLLCLTNGEVLQFSLCNSKIADRTCTSTGVCKYCVSEISQGVYCPASINVCNSMGLQCSQMYDPNSDNNDDTPPNNDSVIIPPINQNSSNEDTNNNPDETTDNSNSKSTKKTVKTTSSSDDTVDSTNLDSNGNIIAVKNDNEGGSFPVIFLLFTTFFLIAVLGFVFFKFNKKSRKTKRRN